MVLAPTLGAMWVPNLIYPDDPECAPCCPNCKNNHAVGVTRARWSPSPARVVGEHYWWILDCKRYPCKKCGTVFRATNPDSVELAPTGIKVVFGIMMGSRISVDALLARRINDMFHSVSAEQIALQLDHSHHELYYNQVIKCVCLHTRRRTRSTSRRFTR